MATPLLAIQALRKGYRGRPVLAGLSFTGFAGEAIGVIGANGAGKSTLLGCLTGDRLPDAGSIRLCGVDPFSDPRAAARCMGVVPEHPFLYGELSVAEMLAFVGEARALPAATASGETERLLALLGLAGAEHTLCRELSQGMARKVAVAAALLHRPRVIVLDEALNGLDRPSSARLVAELDERCAEGALVLLSSHDLDFVAAWCQRALLLLPGARWQALDGPAWLRWAQTPSLAAAHGAGSAPATATEAR